MTIDSTTKVYLNGVEQVKIIKNGSVIWEKQQDNTDYFYIENTYAGSNSVTLTTTNTGTPTSGTYATSVQYSKDKSTWTTLTLTAGSSNSITLNQGEKVYFRNNSGYWNNYVGASNYIHNTFTSTQSIVTGGELYTLLDYTNNLVTLKTGSFFNLFYNCTTLTTAPSLSWTVLADFCYCQMFQGCTSLTSAPALPATTLAWACYQTMFRGCTSLTSAPALPATTLTRGCYGSMFRECSSLITAPELPATTFVDYCYVNMFRDCSSLNSITIYANDISAANSLNTWVQGVAATGTFNNLGSATYTPNSVNGIPAGWTEVKPQPAIDYFYIENTYNGSNTITITTTKYDYSEEDPEADPLDMTKCGTNLEWSKDKSTWNTLTLTESSPNTITMNQGEKVYFRNDSGKFNYMDDWGSFWYSSFTNNHSASTGGDIHTLIDYTGTNINAREIYCLYNLFLGNTGLTDASNLTLPSSLVDGELSSLFFNCGNLTSAPSLPATTLAEYCYYGMFSSSGITTVPVLPATTLAEGCYMEMFQGCSGLITIPSNYLPATSLEYSCYSRMFAYCSNLTTPPSLPATTLSDYCYQGMFQGCSGLITIPSNYLPATTLSDYCYQGMFQGCTSLTSAPALPATDLTDCTFCYESMFQGCSSLTTPPSLPATTLAENCYSYMFESSGITTAPILPATTLEMACYSYMFLNCSSLTTPPALPATNLASNCYMYMFPGSGITTAPVLPAWTLAEYCYLGMFADTSITTAPELPANTLVEGCYMEMFANCESLEEVTCYATDITATDCTTGWLDNVAETGTLYAQRGVDYTTDDPSGVPEGWSVVRMEPS